MARSKNDGSGDSLRTSRRFVSLRRPSLRATKSAAEAARDATEDVQQRLADNHLLLLIPQLKQASRDLENAAGQGHHQAAQKYLEDWRGHAVRVRTLVERQYQGVLQNHDRVRDLRDQYAAAKP